MFWSGYSHSRSPSVPATQWYLTTNVFLACMGHILGKFSTLTLLLGSLDLQHRLTLTWYGFLSSSVTFFFSIIPPNSADQVHEFVRRECCNALLCLHIAPESESERQHTRRKLTAAHSDEARTPCLPFFLNRGPISRRF